MEDKRNFKGVWIPKEVWLDESLTITEKCLMVEIDSLDHSKEGGKGCFKSSEAIGKFLNLSRKRVDAMITDLKKRGHVEQIDFDGRRRYLSLPRFGKAASSDMRMQTPQIREHSNTVSNTKPLYIKGWYQEIKEKHPKLLAKLPQSVDGKTVSLTEVEAIVAATENYNTNRALGMWFVLPDRKNKSTPKSNRNPDAKACKEIVRRVRDGWTLDKMDEIIGKMFGTDYHQDKNFMYLSLEFCHRQDKLEMYENAADAA